MTTTIETVTAPNHRAVDKATAIRDTLVNLVQDLGLEEPQAPRSEPLDQYNARVAHLFETLPEATPEAVSAYEAFRAELAEQYALLRVSGFTFEFCDEDPTPVDAQGRISSGLLLKEIAETNHVRIYRSEPGFHALLDDILCDGETANTIFRAVHDVLGHAATGYSFSQKGETRAYYSHARTFSPLARQALFNEAVAQQAYYVVHGDYSPQRTPVIDPIEYNPPLS